MMEPESLAQLAGSGNASTVEKEWLSLVESKDVELSLLRQYDVVLTTLRKRGDASVAAELAWAAIETVSSRVSPLETLTVAGPFLLAVGEGDELRKQVTELYRAAYEGREGLEALILEAGLLKGRPVRRALRTLNVCLAISEGDYLRARDEPTAAKVLTVSPASCEYEIDTGGRSETFGAVELADNYHPAAEDDFWVMRQFQRDELLSRIKSEPASIVIDICKQHDGKINSDLLESMLTNDLMADGEWKKWWTRARTALKRYPNIELTGRSPYTIRHHDAPVATDEKLWNDFKQKDPFDQLKIVDAYLRECNLCGTEVSIDALRQCFDSFVERWERAMTQSRARAVCFAACAARIGELAGFDDARSKLEDLIRDDDNLEDAFSQLRTDELYRLACDALISVQSDDWQDRLIDLLPTFPLATCDRTASRLVEAGRSKGDFKEPVQKILTSPIKHYEALLWLWDGPSCHEVADFVIPRTLLARVLRMREELPISAQ